MSGVLVRGAGLAGIYLLVMTSVAPGDVLLGGALGLAVAYTLRPRATGTRPAGASVSARARLEAAAATVARTAWEMALGSWQVVRFCLGARAAPGIVEIPRGNRSDPNVALWGVLTGEAPDEVPVRVDEARGVLLVHVVDASDPDAVRARHAHASERQRKVVP